MSLFGIGVSALNAAQLGLATSGHNVASSSDAGYHRQEIIQTTQIPNPTGAGFVGNGTYVSDIRRAYNAFLDGQVLDIGGNQAYLETLLNNVSQIDNLVADPEAGLSPALQEFFRTVQSVSSNPADVPSRQLMLSASSTLVARFQSMNQRLEDLYAGSNTQIEAAVNDINAIAKQVGELNDRIVVAESQAGAHQANDLRDQREKLIAQLNTLAKVQVAVDGNGSYNVSIGNGVGLVVGPNVATLSVAPGADNAQRLDLFVAIGSGSTLLSRSSLNGGQLGALLQFREGEVTDARNALGRIAMVFADAFNDQHMLGQDLNGNIGGAFFSVGSPVLFTSSLNTGTGTLTAAVSNFSQLQASDYRIVYAGAGNYTVTRLSDSVATTQAGPSFAVDGVTYTFGGAPNVGDVFLSQPTVAGASTLQKLISDPNLIAAAGPLRATATATNAGTGKLTVQSNSTTTGIPAAGTMRTLTYNAGVFTSSVGGDTVTLSGTTLTLDTGSNLITMQLNGTPANGDTFNIDRNTGGNTDNHNAVLLGRLATTNLLNATGTNPPTTTLTGAYGQLVAQVGNRTRELRVTETAQETLLDSTKQAQQAFSGVNLDEEAAKLIQYQQAYQAASKVIAIAKETLEEIFNIIG